MTRARATVPTGFSVLPIGGGFIVDNGPLYVRQDGDVVRLGFRVEARHCNLLGILHGGMMATFCDMLLPVAAHRGSAALGQRFLPTVSLQVDYLSPVPQGAWVEGTAQVLRTTRSLVFVQGLVDADGEPAARASGILKIGGPFTPPLPEVG